jgi:hypothetical protein
MCGAKRIARDNFWVNGYRVFPFSYFFCMLHRNHLDIAVWYGSVANAENSIAAIGDLLG